MPVQFPYLVLKDLAPFSVFLVLLLWRKGRRVVWENPATRYAVVILLCNLWLYAISPGVRSRYLYMFYPLFALLAAQLWAQVHHRWRPALRLQAVAGWLVVTGVAAASIVLPFVPVFQDNNEPLLALLVLGVALAAVCGWVLVKRPTYQVAVLVAGMLFARILLNHTILVERTTEGNHLDEYRGAQQLIQYTQNGAKPLKILGAEPSRITIFYYTRETRQVATYAYGLQPGEVGITPQALWNPSLPVPVDSFPIYGGTWYVMLQP
jgi:4-amino-4-deoxy-L-arabinose transferase-like glycosyltransferase